MKEHFETHFKLVEGEGGFSTDSVSQSDLELFREVVTRHYQKVLLNSGFNDEANLNQPIDTYHQFSQKVDHSNIWGKKDRILAEEDLEIFLSSEFFKSMKEQIGEINISGEEGVGYPEIYYRLVRPKPYVDVGPLHADRWFWDLGHGFTPEGYKRIKFWFSLWNEPGLSGFRFVKGSHTKEYDYEGEKRDGQMKPCFEEEKYNFEISPFLSKPGDFIIFNDSLLHGGLIGGEKTRVSFEFTLFIK
ncbi:MAG: hypothetical protein HOD90_07600 [Nitrospina sp.]|jgi:hypothetical protein|nr:hypothetical protein [Nitrospina sp.]MBT5633859.1 hypothetical protein [Nitrospina sp.]